MFKIKYLVYVAVIVITTSFIFYVYFSKNTKKVFTNKVPTNFLSSIPLPKDITLSQSYEVKNKDRTSKQETVVFSSNKSIQENFTLYKNFLLADTWWLPEKYIHQSDAVSSLYANKYDQEKEEVYDINIVISKTGTTTSSVSISLLIKNFSSK